MSLWAHNSQKKNNGKKVFVGLSGGVDSSVSALLLKEQGFEVTGVFIKVWQPDWISCTWREDRLDAMRVCASLNIPFLTIDLEKEYKKEVVDYMIYEYKQGRTPNPDVMCNKYVKFGAFFKWALSQGADYVATGHYAQIKDGSLYKAVDHNKDQTYFLWTLSRDQLSKTLFPIGHLQKSEVRAIATRNNLITAEKKDSQGLCFIGKVDMKDFLKEFISPIKGNVLNEKGEVIGEHDGAVFFTLGERHGFTITKKGNHDLPYYVIKKDSEHNTITVSTKKDTANPSQSESKETTTVTLEKINWASRVPKIGRKYECRARYRQKLLPASLVSFTDSTATFSVSDTDGTITPGQSMVIYNEGECIGGGIIQ